jgi:hypothetical protein
VDDASLSSDILVPSEGISDISSNNAGTVTVVSSEPLVIEEVANEDKIARRILPKGITKFIYMYICIIHDVL